MVFLWCYSVIHFVFKVYCILSQQNSINPNHVDGTVTVGIGLTDNINRNLVFLKRWLSSLTPTPSSSTLTSSLILHFYRINGCVLFGEGIVRSVTDPEEEQAQVLSEQLDSCFKCLAVFLFQADPFHVSQ